MDKDKRPALRVTAGTSEDALDVFCDIGYEDDAVEVFKRYAVNALLVDSPDLVGGALVVWNGDITKPFPNLAPGLGNAVLVNHGWDAPNHFGIEHLERVIELVNGYLIIQAGAFKKQPKPDTVSAVRVHEPHTDIEENYLKPLGFTEWAFCERDNSVYLARSREGIADGVVWYGSREELNKATEKAQMDEWSKEQEQEEAPKYTMTLLPPAPGLCPECAVKHPPEIPHNRDSIYYQTKFNMEHGRAPTWEDAMAHCTEEVKVQARATIERVMGEHKAKEVTH